MTPEFSRIERLDTIGEEPRRVAIAAEADERAAVARRFGLVSVEALEADLAIRRTGGGVAAEGQVRARVTQACTVTGDPIATTVDEAVTLRFVEPAGSEEEVELPSDALDTIEMTGGGVDLGEAAAETMALALDPFPRGPGAAAALKAAGVIAEEDARPLGALAGLRDMLTKKG